MGEKNSSMRNGEMEDEKEGEICSTECSGRTGRRLADYEGDVVARKARCRLRGDRML